MIINGNLYLLDFHINRSFYKISLLSNMERNLHEARIRCGWPKDTSSRNETAREFNSLAKAKSPGEDRRNEIPVASVSELTKRIQVRADHCEFVHRFSSVPSSSSTRSRKSLERAITEAYMTAAALETWINRIPISWTILFSRCGWGRSPWRSDAQ